MSVPTVILKRFANHAEGVVGVMLCNGHPISYTLELPWKCNERNISCIPSGSYNVHRGFHERLGKVFSLSNVPDRDHILFHVGNKPQDTRGCILVGQYPVLNNDLEYSLLRLIDSRSTMHHLHEILPDYFNLKIEEV